MYSIQFLVVDTSFHVINKNLAYLRGIDFRIGHVFNYTSVSESSGRSVTQGGVNMVLREVNVAGQASRKQFSVQTREFASAHENDQCGENVVAHCGKEREINDFRRMD
mmetsp:Transcript_7281/g.15833  ORF Transcript_7281/g.15833 Transcript_7281/m.15833 type:complete len:108 (-) Transcript_7281:45-368(-)